MVDTPSIKINYSYEKIFDCLDDSDRCCGRYRWLLLVGINVFLSVVNRYDNDAAFGHIANSANFRNESVGNSANAFS